MINFYKGFRIEIHRVETRFKPIITDYHSCEKIKTNQTFVAVRDAIAHAKDLISKHYETSKIV
jgi:hypothetical protein